jgi:hypothetical protein
MWQLQFCRGLFYALLAAGRVAQIASTGEGAAAAAAEGEAEAAAQGAETFLLPLFSFVLLAISVIKMQRAQHTRHSKTEGGATKTERDYCFRLVRNELYRRLVVYHYAIKCAP